MAATGPIVIVDDDIDDHEILESALSELGIPNERRFFSLCNEAFDYLSTTEESPMVILCDINMPGIDGLEFKKMLDSSTYLREKSIPFVFLSTSAQPAAVTKAYTEVALQGFFKKNSSVNGLRETLATIIGYWKYSKHPNQ